MLQSDMPKGTAAQVVVLVRLDKGGRPIFDGAEKRHIQINKETLCGLEVTDILDGWFPDVTGRLRDVNCASCRMVAEEMGLVF